MGSVHALLNVAGTALFLASWIARKRQSRRTARWLGVAGLGVVAASAHLGGNLVYEHGIGVQDERPLS